MSALLITSPPQAGQMRIHLVVPQRYLSYHAVSNRSGRAIVLVRRKLALGNTLSVLSVLFGYILIGSIHFPNTPIGGIVRSRLHSADGSDKMIVGLRLDDIVVV